MSEYSDKQIIFLVAELKESIRSLHDSIKDVKEDNKELRRELGEIRAQMNRWKGALPVIIAIGGIIGFLLTFIDKIKGILF